MELDERKRKVLSIIAEVYTATGEPVGSKLVASRLDQAYSSATIRNDMAALFELGLLEQPHTSAGRVLSHLGYRVYVDELMLPRPISHMESIEALFNVRNPDPDRLLEEAVSTLADLTGCAVFTATITPHSVYVRRLELIPTGERTLLLVMVASNGVIRSKVCRTGFVVRKEVVDFFTAFAKSRLVGMSLQEITRSYLSGVSTSLGEVQEVFTPLLGAILELCSEIYAGQYHMAGATNLLRYPEFAGHAYELLRFLEKREQVQALLMDSPGMRTTVSIGKENHPMELQDSSVIISKYNIGSHTTGAIGIIGPIRMDYAAVIAELEYFARLMGERLSETFEDR